MRYRRNRGLVLKTKSAGKKYRAIKMADNDLQNACLQKRQQQLLAVPPSRFTPVSPYPQYTSFQLNMRRKAEILQYKGVQRQTNTITKKQKFAKIMRGNSGGSIPYTYVQECPDNQYTPTPSTSCDVPGPPIVLFNDPNVPLYNYLGVGTRTYGIQNTASADIPFNYYVVTDLSMSSVVSTYYPFFTLLFTNYTDIGYKMYTCSFPVRFLMSGTTAATGNVYVSLSNILVDVYYNNTLMCTNDTNAVYAALSSTLIQIDSDDFRNNLSTVAHMNLQTTAATHFDVLFYAGIVRFYNMTIYSAPGFVYTVRLRPFLRVNPSSALQTTQLQFIVNASAATTTVTGGCSLNEGPSQDPFAPFTMTGE